MEYILMLIGVIISSVFVLIWFVFFFKFRNEFDGILESVDSKIFTLKETYFIGLGFIQIYESITKKKITDSEKALMKKNSLAEVFGRDNADLYYYVSVAAIMSLAITFIPLGLLIGCLMGSLIGFICGLAVAFAMMMGVKSSIDAAVERKKDAIVSEFPKMVSKLTLLINAGMLVRRAWDEVANSNQTDALYAEMRVTSKDIQEGTSIEAAMASFATRCGVKEIRKFSSIYVQAVTKGASESINSMKAMSDDAWMQKKQFSKQRGEIAAQKLLVPNMIMFLGILVLVVAPMVTTLFGSL